MSFPIHRLRRLRSTEPIRKLVREARLSTDRLIYPLFVTRGRGVRREIGSMPGCFQMSPDQALIEAKEVWGLGIPAVVLFGIPEHKDDQGSEAYNDAGIVQQAIRGIKDAVPDLVVITDVCLCEYTSHGHCGVVSGGKVLNDPTLDLLAQEALSHARAGADIVAPSDMMDGRIGAIRKALDGAGFQDLPILSYAVKYASGFYGPFREAAESAPQFGDRGSYQMDPANGREAMLEVSLDLEEGADMVMVKPALPCLDVIREVKNRWNVPVAAYQVSGEYAMIKAAGKLGWLDETRVMMESLTAIHRAGADLILTYFAKEAAARLAD